VYCQEEFAQVNIRGRIVGECLWEKLRGMSRSHAGLSLCVAIMIRATLVEQALTSGVTTGYTFQGVTPDWKKLWAKCTKDSGVTRSDR